MIEFDEIRLSLNAMENSITELKESLNIVQLEEEIKQLEEETAKDGFWDDLENSQKVLQKTKQLKNKVDAYNGLFTKWEDLVVLAQHRTDRAAFIHRKQALIQQPQHRSVNIICAFVGVHAP